MKHLYLYNDHKNNFKYVWACLMEICKHDPIQAEQCCLIAQNNDKAHIKKGEFMDLFEMQTKLEGRGLKVELKDEQYA